MGVKEKTILITGGLGNLGSWLTNHYCNLGYDVTVLTQRKRKLEFNLQFKTIICDITSLENCKSVITKDYDVIIHTASMNDNFVEGYAQNALLVNALGTRNILETIKLMPPKHFIYLSTFHVYGKYSGNISEESELNPNNDYGTTHLFAEYYVKQFHQNHKIPYTIIRLSNSYGCPKDYDSSKWYLILNDLSKSAFEKSLIKLNGNGFATRDFIWMGDVCDIIYRLTNQDSTNNTYNISGEKAYSLLDVAQSVKAAYEEYFKKTIEIETNKEDKSPPKDPIVISSSKIKHFLPYNAESHFKEEALKIFNFLKKK
ncbi:NAD-dependent epimerase/dehydratase family protein [Flaviramulus basaltis]|nr:NAD(P)-dependent oxidoreductase [Flaviramulus basaltis]